MIYNETNLPILKFLRWRRPLVEHPEFVKARKRAVTIPPTAYFNMQMFPILWPAVFPIRDPKKIMLANDAVFGLSRVWPELAEAASEKIEAVSSTFLNALQNSYDAFLSVEHFSRLEGERLNGTLVIPGGSVFCYDFVMSSPYDDDGKLRYLIDGTIIRLQNGRNLVCDLFPDVQPDGTRPGTVSWHDMETMTACAPKAQETKPGTIGELMDENGMDKNFFDITEGFNDNVMGSFDLIIVYHLFKKFAPIDVIESAREHREHPSVPQIKTNQPVTYLDCSWYTTIVRTEGFNVRGHFRLQPCGEGKKDRKLIYIHEFQKHGYVRRARLQLNEDGDNIEI